MSQTTVVSPLPQITGAISMERPASAPPATNMGGSCATARGLTPQQKCDLQAQVGTTPTSGPGEGGESTRGIPGGFCRRCGGAWPCRICPTICSVCKGPFPHQNPCVKRGDLKKGNARWNAKGNSGGQTALNQSVQDMADRSVGADIALRDFSEQNEEQQAEILTQKGELNVLKQGVLAANTIITELKDELAARDAVLEEESAAISKDHYEKDEAMVVGWTEDAPVAWWRWLALAAVPAASLGLGVAITYGLTKSKFGVYESSGAWKLMTLGVVTAAAQTLAVRLTNKLCAFWGYRNLWGERPKHTITAVSRLESDQQDRRSDMMSMRKMKHKLAKYQWFDFAYTSSGLNINRNKYGERSGKPVRALVSMELLRQITVPSATMSEDVITLRQRLTMIAKSTHTLNLDAEMNKRDGCDVVQNTIELAVGLWEQHREGGVRFV
jgi:hypothetical protein